MVVFFSMKAFALLALVVATVSMYAESAFAQLTARSLGGVPVPVNNSELFLALMENNIVWMAPAAVAGFVIYKIKSKKK